MKVIHLRFNNTLISTLALYRERRERFQRLLADHPTGVEVQRRGKSPGMDLKAGYHRNLLAGFGLSVLLIGGGMLAFPTLEIQSASAKTSQIVINVEDIPETRQIDRPPPPPRPAVPIETESDDVPEDVTIETTDLDFDNVDLDLPPPPSVHASSEAPQEEEILEIWKVEEKPKLIRQIAPVFPAAARKAGIQGAVFVKVLVGTDGKVKHAEVVKGHEIFHESALEAARGFVFMPAMQNERPVKVWVTIPIEFRLIG